MADRNGIVRYINVRECKRINGKESILVCRRCGNEVEGKPNSDYWLNDRINEPSLVPCHNFCPWCSAPLREADDG